MEKHTILPDSGKVVPFLLLVKSHALFPNSEKYVVEIRLSPLVVLT